MMENNIYSSHILKMAPKVLSQIDRDKDSKNYGDCDRNHWHLKTRDFSSAILQQSGLAVALMYLVDFPGNIFFGRDDVKQWAIATVSYWQKIQLRDGSFNEYYPNEHGFPPTAFSLFSACEIFKRLKIEDESLKDSFRKTCKYLCKHIEYKASNQEMASITALYSAYTILNEQWILDGLNSKLNRLLKTQSSEGWFAEYEGADIGYLSVTLDMMAEYYSLSNDSRVIEPLNNIVSFLKYFVHPDGTVGGEYASRNTIYFLPNGLEVLSQMGNEEAEAMIQALYAKENPIFDFLDGVDDRYWSHYLLHSFLRAIERRNSNSSERQCAVLPCISDEVGWMADSGMLTIGYGNGQYVIASSKKGGVVRAFTGGSQCFSDYGYRVRMKDGSVAATNWWNNSNDISYSDGVLVIKGRMIKVGQKVSTPIMHMGLRVVSAVVGNKIISFLKKQIILVNKQSDIQFERKISFSQDKISIEDEISSPEMITLNCADCYSLRHVASGKFFAISDIDAHSDSKYENIKHIRINRELIFDTKEIIEKYEVC